MSYTEPVQANVFMKLYSRWVEEEVSFKQWAGEQLWDFIKMGFYFFIVYSTFLIVTDSMADVFMESLPIWCTYLE